MDLIEAGITRNLIRLEDGDRYIVYVHQDKRRKYQNPEEKVVAHVFLRLVLDYEYPGQCVRLFFPVQAGARKLEADIVVFEDEGLKQPRIIAECKRPNVSELEFARTVEQAFSYAVSEGARYVWVSSKLKDEYYEVSRDRPKTRLTIADIPQRGVDRPPRFKYAYKGGKASNGQRLSALQTVTEEELTRRFHQAHQALWGGGELNPSEAFDELDKLIFCKLWDEHYPHRPGASYNFQIIMEQPADQSEEARRKAERQTNEKLLARIELLYAQGRKKDPAIFKDPIRLNAAKARTVVSYLESVNLYETDLDSKGRAFETFLDSLFRGEFGQYFTPRAIVKFIVDVLPIQHNSLVLDPACGCGGFLWHALDKVRKQTDAGCDRDIGEHDNAKCERDKVKNYKICRDFADRNLFGIEINEQIARAAKMNMLIHGDSHANIVVCDGLLPIDAIAESTENTGFVPARFDFIITNPPFGSTVKRVEKPYMDRFNFAKREADWLSPGSRESERPAQATEVLFIEQCWKFLVEGGYLAIVVPDGLLTNWSLQYVRGGVEELFRIIAVVSLPQHAFTATGAGVKSSVLILKKLTAQRTKEIRDNKQRLRDQVFTDLQLVAALEKLAATKEKSLADILALREFAGMRKSAIRRTPDYKERAESVLALCDAEMDRLRHLASERYARYHRETLRDYDIFMAIAEEIGYDASGKKTGVNDLDAIGEELKVFIGSVEREREAACVERGV